MKQLSLFEDNGVTIRYEKRPGWKKGWWKHTATVVDGDGFPLIFVEAELFGRSSAESDTIKVARLAYLLRHKRPMGDSYKDGVYDVVYLFENEG